MESSPTVKASSSPRGFTLVEMIVVLAIIVLITGIALSGQVDFNRSLTVTDTAYTVALSIRQAQTFGLSSRTYNGTSKAGYGAHFSITTPMSYLLFADVAKPTEPPSYCPVGTAGLPDAKPGNCTYDPSGSEVIQSYTFGRGFSITNICGHDTGNTLRCTTGGYLTGLDVVFLRPNTDSIVTGLRASGNIQLLDAQVTLTAPGGDGSRYVCVTQVGEVSVASTTCP